MAAKVRAAINGYGRIGKSILRAFYENDRHADLELVALNNRAPLDYCVHSTRYDTTHGKFNAEVDGADGVLKVDGDEIQYCSESDPARLPWKSLDVDVVLECTGKFNSREKASAHLEAGAKKVLLSAPGAHADATVVYGVNHAIIKPQHQIVSNASCTTNCLVPVVKILDGTVGVARGLITTVHAYTNDQVLTDANHKDKRRARAAAISMIPTKTGAAKAVGLVLPELAGKLHGHAIRVPTLNVSMVDLTIDAKRETSAQEVNSIMRQASEESMRGILAYCDEPLVSIDFNHSSASSIFDATLTQVMDGALVKVSAWYDNEWAYAERMLDTAIFMGQL